MFFKRFVTMFFVASLFATQSFSMKRLWTGFHSLKTKISNFNPNTVATEFFFGNMDFNFYKEPEYLNPEYREIITYQPKKLSFSENWKMKWLEKRKTIFAKSYRKPTKTTQQRSSQFSKKQHNNLRKQYLQEAVFEIQRYKKSEINTWDFENKVRVNITEKVNNELINGLKQNGISIENIQPENIDNLIQTSRQREDVQKYMEPFTQKLKECNYYQKMMKCAKQKDQRACKVENKNLLDSIAADFFKTYYEYDPKKSSSANKIKMGKNYLLKRIPVEIGLAAMCASNPDNLKKLEDEL